MVGLFLRFLSCYIHIEIVFPVIPYYIGDELLQLGIAQFLVQWDV